MGDRRVPMSERAGWLVRQGTPSAESLAPGPIDRLRGREKLSRSDLDETFDTVREMVRGNPGLRLKRKFSPVGHVWKHLRGNNDNPFTSARLLGPDGARVDFMDRLVFEGFRAIHKNAAGWDSVEVDHADPDALPVGVALAERLQEGDRVSIRPEGYVHELRTTPDGRDRSLAALEELGCNVRSVSEDKHAVIRFKVADIPAEEDAAEAVSGAA